MTDNFGSKSFIGEGAYGKVYRATLKTGHEVAIKKLDSSKQPDQEFLSQVWFNYNYNSFNIKIVKLKHDLIFSIQFFNLHRSPSYQG